MVMHGRDTFSLEGEGVFSSSADQESVEVRRLAPGEAPPFRFRRVGPRGAPPLGVPLLRKVALAMVEPERAAVPGDVPAGYTYLGQFVDHDLTLDRTQVELGEDVTPGELVQGRSPRLDLDSLYGVGPQSEGSARFYEDDGLHLRTGDTRDDGLDGVKVGHDLPRRTTGPLFRQREAVIPDPRNDENLIVAQTHLAMIHFHNRVVDKLPASTPPARRFRRARKSVSLHYQWLLRHDYLPRILDPAVLDDVFANGRVLVEPDAGPTDVPAMPVEFSVGAFRLGHSMVRDTYDWNRRFPGTAGGLEYMFDFSGTGGTLGGDTRLASSWIADWRRMYDFPAGERPRLAGPNGVNHALRIDTRITNPLQHLPSGTFGGPESMPFDDVRRNLAFRNLRRASMLRLCTGQQLAERLAERGRPVPALTRSQLLRGDGGADLSGLSTKEKDAVVLRTPLWFYVLREAELNGGRMSGVGARVVAETFHRAMEGSRFSILRDPAFRPSHGRGDVFEMTDLLFFAFAGKKSEINPLGGK